MKLLLAPVPAALVLAAAAAAASIPAVPPFIQHVAAAKAGDFAYVPTRLPFRYRYRSYRYDPATRLLTFRFADVRFPPGAKHSLAFTAEPFRGRLETCGDGRQKTLQMGGNKVYWDGGLAWRCQRTPGGRIVKLLASGPGLPDVALGRVVASAKHVG